jgi:hypothetical protein
MRQCAYIKDWLIKIPMYFEEKINETPPTLTTQWPFLGPEKPVKGIAHFSMVLFNFST